MKLRRSLQPAVCYKPHAFSSLCIKLRIFNTTKRKITLNIIFVPPNTVSPYLGYYEKAVPQHTYGGAGGEEV
jgi:hypothetical protein